jgi:hypothetical protein
VQAYASVDKAVKGASGGVAIGVGIGGRAGPGGIRL